MPRYYIEYCHIYPNAPLHQGRVWHSLPSSIALVWECEYKETRNIDTALTMTRLAWQLIFPKDAVIFRVMSREVAEVLPGVSLWNIGRWIDAGILVLIGWLLLQWYH